MLEYAPIAFALAIWLIFATGIMTGFEGPAFKEGWTAFTTYEPAIHPTLVSTASP